MESLIELEDFPGRLLHQAALWDNAELLEDLLNGDEIKCLNSKDSWGRTPLHAAATNAGSRCLRILAQAGADLDSCMGPRGEGRTALHVAAEHGHASNLAILVEAGASLLIRDNLGLTPLDVAEKADHEECMIVLRAAADKIEAQRIETLTILQDACSQGDLPAVKSILTALDPGSIQNLINFAPGGANTLLFKSCENGHKEVVNFLLDKGADGRIHSVTKYSPLYIAAYNGRRDIVDILLKRFPNLINVLTVEKWSPLHAAVINGHVSTLDLLLRFSYPKECLKTMRDKKGSKEYDVPFDINLRDVNGQTVLYLACCVGNLKIVELLLKYQVKARKISGKTATLKKKKIGSKDDQSRPSMVATRTTFQTGSAGTSQSSIQALISKLRWSSQEDSLGPDEEWISPLELDVYCNNGTETALHHVVKMREHTITHRLLQAGANPNLVIYAAEKNPENNSSYHPDRGSSSRSSSSMGGSSSTGPELESSQNYFRGSTCLVEACKNRDMAIIDLLLKYSARDDDCKALAIVLENQDELIASKLLALKAHKDAEHDINKKGISDQAGIKGLAAVGSLAYSSIFPTTSVMINWHQNQLAYLKEQWLVDASVRLNPKLKLSPKYQISAVHAITRLDLSSNDLSEIPPIIFQMQSLRSLCLAQNKIEVLPPPYQMRGKEFHYQCPMLEEVQLQDNRLEVLHPAFFSSLKSLTCLDVSNNKLLSLPYELWSASKLKELNASFNLLSELPMSDMVLTKMDELFDSDSSSVDNVSATDLDLDSTSDNTSIDDTMSIRSRNTLNRCDLKHHSLWSQNVEIRDKTYFLDTNPDGGHSKKERLQILNLSHNAFSVTPRSLACLAPQLTRLNLSYNKLAKMGHVATFPASLKHLDLSHNQIDAWFFETGVDNLCYSETKNTTTTYHQETLNKKSSSTSSMSSSSSRMIPKLAKLSVTSANCPHKKHSRLDNLRTLILSDNFLDHLKIHTSSSGTGRVLFPVLSMLDLSNNMIANIPKAINELANLSVLNLSGNLKISDLPAQMGLLTKLWNLNTRGCSLHEPLSTMMTSKSYKTSDVIGYLRSILEHSKPYARLKLMVVGIQGIGKTSLLEILRQEGGSFRRKPTEHWAKRMGNKNINMKTGKGVSISTVGVDIGDWTFEKKERGTNQGPVIFRTWDFGGQTEYYATHQYFLSKRSLYIVVWKITDGERGVNEIQQWLINIQARAPNSPVIIVGTHVDVVKDEFPPSFSEYLQQKIRGKFISITDPEKFGLPRVLDSIEVSCKTRQNIRLLANLLYDTAFSLKSPGSMTRLLEQKVPALYLALEDVISHMASDLRGQGHDPVLRQEQYETMVKAELTNKHGLKFRDSSELSQATKFLHENGLMLHYEDATLRDLYFLDPQWLCDMLSHVVTIREINPFAKNGIMKLEDLRHVFKSSSAVTLNAKSYVVNLLNKFEVALTWDSRTLLIPSLLPTEQQMRSGIPGLDMRVKVPVRSRGWGFRGRRNHNHPPVQLEDKAQPSSRSRSVPSRALLKTKDISRPSLSKPHHPEQPQRDYEVSHRKELEHSIQRLVLMSYFPSGFWSRILTRILADDSVVEIVRNYFIIPDEVRQDPILNKIYVENKPEWVCWQTGIELRYLDAPLFSMKQVLPKVKSVFEYNTMKMMLFQDDNWSDIDTINSSILELSLPQDTVVIKRPIFDAEDENSIGYYQAIVLDPNPKAVCQLLALAVEHVDTLLEDWYPSLGTRFLHTSEGKMLVTRLVPCPRCLTSHNERESTKSWQDWSFLKKLQPQQQQQQQPPRPSEVLRVSQDSGMGQESPRGSQNAPPTEEASETVLDEHVYAFMVEECILLAFEGQHAKCPVHGDLFLGQIAPDTVFLDLEDRLRIQNDLIKRGGLIGRGAFGFVYEAVCRPRGIQTGPRNVALKMLQPISPGLNADEATLSAFEAAKAKWDRDPQQYASKSYCSARQELSVLIHLKHGHIVPLVGICVNPLAIVLELAPLGALDQQLKHYRRSGDKLAAKSCQVVILQVAKALEYLHQQHIIYRDLKSENVLVWQFPEPFSKEVLASPRKMKRDQEVHVKLADYGISRPTLPTGAKGFGGTEGFMAPEIVKYNGEEEYTEKVDCFSFGMFIYELLTLQQPFTGYETVKELILEGGRPPLTSRELIYPTYLLDLMVICWSQQPRHRPTASQIVSIASAPEFLHLMDVVSLDQGSCSSATFASKSNKLWMSLSSGFTDKSQLHVLDMVSEGSWQEDVVIKSGEKIDAITSLCQVQNHVWIGDNAGFIHAFEISSYTMVFSYKMEPDLMEEPSPVRSIHYLPKIQRVCVAMHNGRLFLCDADVIPSSQSGGEGTFLVTELGAESCIHSLASMIPQADQDLVEIWCGLSQGSIAVFTMKEGVVTSQQVINHNDPVVDNVEVLQVVTDNLVHAWTFLYPGYYVYQWEDKQIKNRLDCSKLVPCSESMKSIAIDEHFSPGRCQVISMTLHDQKLYIGTSWGCLIITEADTLRPITVFRPFSDEVQAILPATNLDQGFLRQVNDHKDSENYIITLGKGHRGLIERYVTNYKANETITTNNEEDDDEHDSSMLYAILWKPDDWLTD